MRENMMESSTLNSSKAIWRDLALGEIIKPGDRFISKDGQWVELIEEDLEISNRVTEYTRQTQRRVSAEMHVGEEGMNEAKISGDNERVADLAQKLNEAQAKLSTLEGLLKQFVSATKKAEENGYGQDSEHRDDGWIDQLGEALDDAQWLLSSQGGKPLAWGWQLGEPPKIYRQEWFIAETVHGEKVVLTGLPEENSYDYTTKDGTYCESWVIKRWMQFPDSSFLPPDQIEAVETPRIEVPKSWELHAKVNVPDPYSKGHRIVGYRVTPPEQFVGVIDWLPDAVAEDS